MSLRSYNRDWIKYLSYRYRKSDGLITFRLRNGQKISMHPESRFTLNETYLDRVYDVPGVDWGSCRHVLDLGANVGMFALYVASRNPRATIYCFEPESRNFDALRANIKSNKASACIYQMAVAAKCGKARLELRGPLNHRLSAAGDASESVECADLDAVHRLTGIQQFDFSKIDIEGAETEILASATDLQLRRLGAISMEWHHSDDKLRDAERRLRQAGFEAKAEVQQGLSYLKASRQSAISVSSP